MGERIRNQILSPRHRPTPAQASFNLHSSKPQALGGELQMLTDDALVQSMGTLSEINVETLKRVPTI